MTPIPQNKRGEGSKYLAWIQRELRSIRITSHCLLGTGDCPWGVQGGGALQGAPAALPTCCPTHSLHRVDLDTGWEIWPRSDGRTHPLWS
jgi:hypothetical protein